MNFRPQRVFVRSNTLGGECGDLAVGRGMARAALGSLKRLLGQSFAALVELAGRFLALLKPIGSFVREAGSRQENVAIIQSIVQLAKSFRMSVTAEGVETAEDFERMRELGCDTIQGYLFGRPLSYDRANQMVLGLSARRMAS